MFMASAAPVPSPAGDSGYQGPQPKLLQHQPVAVFLGLVAGDHVVRDAGAIVLARGLAMR